MSNKLRFIAAKPIPQVLRSIITFTLGARSVNPKVTTQVIFTGDWSLPVKEAEATSSVVNQGADVVTCHVAMGFSVWKIRLACITAGSFLAGIGGAYLSLFYPGGWNKRSLAGAPGALGKDI